ncbi:phosphotransferase [Nocardiopsis sp. CC223A]|uniref:phosphotransferase n=1 Tax=Nocardiopsis sp. CC223A TaxID=3044051 RepID=UPI00278BDC46|nr:phosphotransferase [Nocardiopsis sp. CC223A]
MKTANLQEFGTELHHTSVLALADGSFRWEYVLGAKAPEGFRQVPEDLRAQAFSEHGGVSLSMGDAGGTETERAYSVQGGCSAALLLLLDGADSHPELVPLLRGLGRTLRDLHAAPLRAEGHPPPPGLTRLGLWLDELYPPESGDGKAQRFLRAQIGEGRWEALRRWRTELTSSEGAVLCHGAPRLGSLTVSDDPYRAVLLSGQDVGAASPLFDVGWVIGELLDLRWKLGGRDGGAAWTHLLGAFSEGYGKPAGAEETRAAVLRILLHLHDFLVYVGWNAVEFERYAQFLKYLVDRIAAMENKEGSE